MLCNSLAADRGGCFGSPYQLGRAALLEQIAGLTSVCQEWDECDGFRDRTFDPLACAPGDFEPQGVDPRAMIERVAANSSLPAQDIVSLVREFVPVPHNALRLAEMAIADFAGVRARRMRRAH